MTGVSFVMPVHNGERWIRAAIDAVLAQPDGRPMEVIVVDDCSQDGSSSVLRELAADRPLRVISGEGRGASAAINAGVRAARYPIVCQVDQDVIVRPGWMSRLLEALDDPHVAAAQGYYTTAPDDPLCARVMGMDLAQRYAALAGRAIDHVCTGNSAYRVEAIRNVGFFDETLGYGYDNDMSYRLRQAGHTLVFCREARSLHRWRDNLTGYLIQQYGFGYGRIDLVAKHPGRAAGDCVSPAGMMAHPLLMSLVIAGLLAAMVMALAGLPWRILAGSAAALLTVLTGERLIAGISAAIRFRDPAGLLFPLLHLARDLAWVAAIVMWSLRWVVGRPRRPSHSMRPRAAIPVNIVPGLIRTRTHVAPGVPAGRSVAGNWRR